MRARALECFHARSALGRARARAIAPALALRERFELRHRSPRVVRFARAATRDEVTFGGGYIIVTTSVYIIMTTMIK